MNQIFDLNDETQFRFFYQESGRAAVAKALRTVRRLDIAEEIAQDAYLDLWKSNFVCENKKQAFAWIYKACHHKGIDYLRKSSTKKESELLDNDFAIEQINEVERLISVELLDSLVLRLTKRQLVILLAQEIDGMTQEEIASFTDVSRKTIVREIKKTKEIIEKVRKTQNYE